GGSPVVADVSDRVAGGFEDFEAAGQDVPGGDVAGGADGLVRGVGQQAVEEDERAGLGDDARQGGPPPGGGELAGEVGGLGAVVVDVRAGGGRQFRRAGGVVVVPVGQEDGPDVRGAPADLGQ